MWVVKFAWFSFTFFFNPFSYEIFIDPNKDRLLWYGGPTIPGRKGEQTIALSKYNNV